MQRRGVLSGLLFLGYGTIRIVLEIVRNPDLAMPVFPLGLTMGMMLSVPLVTAGAFLLARRARP
jgi:phosphatidylglycerol:prolipoprotein diacylglycerol transferase